MIESLWEQIANLTLIAVLLRVTVPILLSALGGLISDLGGVINIGLEGLMLISAFFSIAVGASTGSWMLGVAAGVLASALVSYGMGFFSLKMKVDIIIASFAVNIFGSGFTILMMSKIYGLTGNFSPTQLNNIPTIHIPVIQDIPLLGTLLSGHNLMVWVALSAVLFCFYMLYRTPYGIHLRSIGEAPEAARSLGIKVERIQYSALIWSGVFAGLAGSYLSMGMTSMFVKDMTAGTGFLALAVVLLGNRNPLGIFFGALVFGLATAITTIVETTPGSPIPSQFIKMIPYVVTVIALVLFAIRKKREASITTQLQ